MTDDKMYELLCNKLINTFKKYPTAIQDTLLRLIAIRLNELNTQLENFSEEILVSHKDSYDILKAKAAQFDYDINTKYSLSEQINLLNSIYTIYSKRGSVDSIKHMWKYYGRDLPKNVEIQIPAAELFRYSISKLSGTHKFQDGVYYRAGVYTIVIDGEYDLDQVREFVLNELVTAGRKVNFNKKIFSYLLGDLSADTIICDRLISRFSVVSILKTGLIWSTNSKPYMWSGSANLLIDIARIFTIDKINFNYIVDEIERNATTALVVKFLSYYNIYKDDLLLTNKFTLCTNIGIQKDSSIHYYDSFGNEKQLSEYPGYFIIGSTKLREVILRDES